MILYLTIIVVAFNAIALTCGIFGVGSIGLAYVQTSIALGAVVAVDIVVALAVRLIPEERLNPFARTFIAGKAERQFYSLIKVRRWKDYIPETGKYLVHFAKDKIAEPHNNEYIIKFLRETCYASLMHVFSFAIPFAFMPFLPIPLPISLAVTGVNAFLQMLPVFVQRSNRPRLVSLYNYNLRHEGIELNETQRNGDTAVVG